MHSKTKGATKSKIGKKKSLGLFKTMLRIRRVEETLMEVFGTGEIPGFLHVCLGQEAAPAAICALLEPYDYMGTTHRGHGYALAKGVELERFMAELLGRADGYCLGRSGSMHLADAANGLLGANGIVGGGIPIATGAALAAQLKYPGRVAVCTFGEGASSQGTFHESLNMAALWKLPVVYLCENNGWAEFTPQSVHMTVQDVAVRAEACGVSAVVVPNQVEAILDAATEAVSRARQGQGPSLLEVKCNRWHGHYVGDAQGYRGKEAVAEAMSQDCLRDYEALLIKRKVLDREGVAEWEKKIREEISAALEFARKSPVPNPEELMQGLYI